MIIPKRELKRYTSWRTNGRGHSIYNLISYLQQESAWAKLFSARDDDGSKVYFATVEGKTYPLEDVADQFIEGAKC